jgi:hypothetical protein
MVQLLPSIFYFEESSTSKVLAAILFYFSKTLELLTSTGRGGLSKIST